MGPSDRAGDRSSFVHRDRDRPRPPGQARGPPMRRIRAGVALLSLLVVVAIAASQVPVATAQSTEGVTVEIHPAATDGAVGDTFDIEVTVVNRGPEITPRLAAHIDVTDPGSESSVDPEDWTPTLTRAVGALAPGTQVTLRWKIQPISAGSYVLYAVALVADRQATPQPRSATLCRSRSASGEASTRVASSRSSLRCRSCWEARSSYAGASSRELTCPGRLAERPASRSSVPRLK